MTVPHDPTRSTFDLPEGDYERFLYSVSHDLQEPLRMVTSFLKLLNTRAGDKLDDEAQRYLAYTLENAERMKHMIHALVELSRIGRDTAEAESTCLSGILGDLEIMRLAGHKGGTVKIINVAPQCAFVAPRLAMKLLSILFDNSLQHHPAGRPLTIVFSSDEENNNGYTTYTFSDDGEGMPAAFTPMAFEMFKKARRESPNIGCGLALAKAIVTKYGGKIDLRSEEGQRAVVSFSLPTAHE